MNGIVIVAAARTAVGIFGGSLAKISAADLGAQVIKDLLAQIGVDPQQINEVIMGQLLTAGCGQNPARQAVIKSGLPNMVPAFIVGKVCGSGLKATHLAAQAIRCGDANIIIAGGQENMSASLHVLNNSRDGFRMGDAKLVDTMTNDGLWDAYNHYHMGTTAENVAKKFVISPEEQDAFALASQNKAEAAQKAGRFKDEILPLEIASKKATSWWTPMNTSSMAPPSNRYQDCARYFPKKAPSLPVTRRALMTAATVKQLGLKVLTAIKAYSSAGLDPSIMGMGSVSASQLCLKKAGRPHQDLDLLEINETFPRKRWPSTKKWVGTPAKLMSMAEPSPLATLSAYQAAAFWCHWCTK